MRTRMTDEARRLANCAKARRWRLKHVEQHRESVRRWAKANPDKVRANWHRHNRRNPERVRSINRLASRRWKLRHAEAYRTQMRLLRARRVTRNTQDLICVLRPDAVDNIVKKAYAPQAN